MQSKGKVVEKMSKASNLEHAKRLHEKFFVADAHNDILCNVLRKRADGRTHVIATDYIPDMRAGGVDLVVCSLFVSDAFFPEMALRNALDQIAALHEEIAESPGLFRICRNADEIRAANKAGEVAFLLSLEGVEPLGQDIALLRVFHALGVRGVGLVWSRRNYAGDGCSFKPREEGLRGGLTHWGVQLLKEIERLGMYLDVSHLNDEGFADVVKFWKGPFMASHSNSRELTHVMRNLTNEHLKEIASRGGFVGLNVCSAFCGDEERGKKIGIGECADHIKKILSFNVPIGFGFDFCDELRELVNLSKNYDSIPDYVSALGLTAKLLDDGVSESDLEKILGHNLLSFIERAVK